MENYNLIKVIGNNFIYFGEKETVKIKIFDYEINNSNELKLKESTNKELSKEIKKYNYFLNKLMFELNSPYENYIFDICIYEKEYYFLLKNYENIEEEYTDDDTLESIYLMKN